jgi:hypothetical protein
MSLPNASCTSTIVTTKVLGAKADSTSVANLQDLRRIVEDVTLSFAHLCATLKHIETPDELRLIQECAPIREV